jgi:hypothetical protein
VPAGRTGLALFDQFVPERPEIRDVEHASGVDLPDFAGPDQPLGAAKAVLADGDSRPGSDIFDRAVDRRRDFVT